MLQNKEKNKYTKFTKYNIIYLQSKVVWTRFNNNGHLFTNRFKLSTINTCSCTRNRQKRLGRPHKYKSFPKRECRCSSNRTYHFFCWTSVMRPTTTSPISPRYRTFTPFTDTNLSTCRSCSERETGTLARELNLQKGKRRIFNSAYQKFNNIHIGHDRHHSRVKHNGFNKRS